MKKFLEKASVIAPFAFLLPALALAQNTPPEAPDILQSGIGGVGTTLCTIFNWLFYFLIILAIIFVVIAAFRYLFAAGDPEKVKSAGHMLIYAAVAVAVGLIAKAVPGLVITLMGATGGTFPGC